jgi:hypothetical protein
VALKTVSFDVVLAVVAKHTGQLVLVRIVPRLLPRLLHISPKRLEVPRVDRGVGLVALVCSWWLNEIFSKYLV